MNQFFTDRTIPEKIYDDIIRKQRADSKDNPDFLKLCEESEKLRYKISKEDISAFLKNDLSSYLKGPVKETLTILKKKGYVLMILTKGIDYYQRFKIRQSGIEKFFGKHIYVCDEKKEEALRDVAFKGVTYFIDDHADEIETILKKFPDFKIIYVKGPKTAHDRFIEHEHIPTITDISELPKMI